jgi:hypothetical protein
MTRQLRQRHRRIMFALAILVPLVFITGMLARRAIPVMPAGVTFTKPTPR